MREKESKPSSEVLKGIVLKLISLKTSNAFDVLSEIKESHIWSSSDQTVYRTIKELEKKSLIEEVSHKFQHEKNKKTYKITKDGVEELIKISQSLKSGFEYKNQLISFALLVGDEKYLNNQRMALNVLHNETSEDLKEITCEKAKILIEHDLDQIKMEMIAIEKSIRLIQTKQILSG